jgi:hypothetical protein
LAEAIHARYRAWCSSAPTAACGWASWPGSAKGRIDLLAWAVTVAEILTEVKGKLIAHPPKTRAGRRTLGLPPFVVRELEAHLPPRSGPAATSLPPPVGAAATPELPGALLGAGDQGSHLQGLHITIFATPAWRCRSPSATPKEVAVRRAHLGQLDPGPLRPPDGPLAGRGGPVPSSKGLDFEVRQHRRKPQDARSPG